MRNIDVTDLIGVPFENRGRDVETGLDCYGLVMEVYRRYGINLPEYTADFDDTALIDQTIEDATASSVWREANPEKLKAPTVIAMRFGCPRGVVNHTGVYIGGGRFIHTRERIGACIDRLNSPAWKRCIEGYYEYIGGDRP